MTDLLLPNRLYKYQRLSADSLANLKARVLWFSAPSRFNDPFDCALQVAPPNFTEDELVRLLEHYQAEHAALTGAVLAEVMSKGKPTPEFHDRVVAATREAYATARKDGFENRGIACLSARPDDMLLWSHYADGHRGFCLEFDTSQEPFSRAEPVQYRTDVPRISPVDLLEGILEPKDIIRSMMFTKDVCWAYEREWRILHQQPDVSFTYPHQLLTGVYLGASMTAQHRDVIGQLLVGSRTQIYEMKPNEEMFGVYARPTSYEPFVYPDTA